jgi:hypothetical protein
VHTQKKKYLAPSEGHWHSVIVPGTFSMRWRPEQNPEGVSMLRNLGYVILERYFAGSRLEQLQAWTEGLFQSEGADAGREFRTEPGSIRLANLVDKGAVFRELIADETILAWVQIVLGQRFKLSSLNARKALGDNGVRQPLHCDMGAVPDADGYWVCNTIWMLDTFHQDNGPTRIVPGTHLSGQTPGHEMKDPCDVHPEEIYLQAPAGSVAIINAHAWHGGTENRVPNPRTALHAFYVRRDKPQQQYQKKLLSDDTVACLSPEQRELLALDDPENDRLSANPGQVSGFMK